VSPNIQSDSRSLGFHPTASPSVSAMPNSPRFFDFFLKEELMGDGHEDTSAK
jgi:hypothetical protein